MAAVLQPPHRRIRTRNPVILGIGLLCVCLPAFAGSYEQVNLVSDIFGIGGLWGLKFGGGGKNAAGVLVNGAPNELFFTAGIDHEGHGLFGKIAVDPDDHDDDHGDH